MGFNSNILLALFIAIVLIAVIYYFSRSRNTNSSPTSIPDGEIEAQTTIPRTNRVKASNLPFILQRRRRGLNTMEDNDTVTGTPTHSEVGAPLSSAFNNTLSSSLRSTDRTVQNRPLINNRLPISESDQMVRTPSRRNNNRNLRNQSENINDLLLEINSLENPHGNYIEARLSEIDDSESEPVFVHKKKKFVRRTPSDIADQFDVEKMLPQEIEEDWFDLPLLGSNSTKRVNNANLIHPKTQMGINTVSGSLRYASHDIRGDIPNPKIHVSPWLNSTIEPDTNLRGLCN